MQSGHARETTFGLGPLVQSFLLVLVPRPYWPCESCNRKSADFLQQMHRYPPTRHVSVTAGSNVCHRVKVVRLCIEPCWADMPAMKTCLVSLPLDHMELQGKGGPDHPRCFAHVCEVWDKLVAAPCPVACYACAVMVFLSQPALLSPTSKIFPQCNSFDSCFHSANARVAVWRFPTEVARRSSGLLL